MSSDCINLKEVFGDRYKVRYEESYYAERPEYRRAEAAWLMIIPCRNGHISAGGGSVLMACTDSAGPVAKRLRALRFARVAQDGDDGVNVLFDLKHFDEVAEIMKPRRRRRLSPEQRRKAADRLRPYRLVKGQNAKNPARQSAGAARESKVTAGMV